MRHAIASRKEQAQKIYSILSDFLNEQGIYEFQCIEVGCGSGEISAFFADKVKTMWGIEIDIGNILKHQVSSQANLAFSHADGANLPFKESTFDLVLFPQVYEHTTQQQKVINEIFRILRPGGICFFSGPNRYQLIEPHFFLPFLSWLPHCLADLYLKLTKKGKVYDIYPRNYWRLKKLTRSFKRYDYTYQMIKNPENFGLESRVKRTIINKLPTRLVKWVAPFYPNYNWILVKE